jgi:hypothetical protein
MTGFGSCGEISQMVLADGHLRNRGQDVQDAGEGI